MQYRFAETARRLRMEQLEQTADRLGLARSVGWQDQHIAGMPVLKHFDHEEPGRIRTRALNRQTRVLKSRQLSDSGMYWSHPCKPPT